jgi:phospho-N-acetylmuramoyl-pentapeptide-transferase
MGGILIWSSIVLTVLFSRGLAFFGYVDASVLSRGQVYLPLFVMLSLGVLGAIDDYLNIVGANEAEWNRILPKIRTFTLLFVVTIVAILLGSVFLGFSDQLIALPFSGRVRMGLIGMGFAVVVLLTLLITLGLSGAIVDDVLRRFVLREGKKRGLGVVPKLTSLIVLSGITALWFYLKLDYDTVSVPWVGQVTLGAWYVPIAMFIIIATANAVNVTDGLDGLAAGLLVIAFAAFGVLAYLQGLFALAAFCAVTAAAVAAFLWHNVPPALFFMGDTGSLALGGALGTIALMTDQMLLLPLIGFVFVVEMLSVIIQLTSKKLRGGKKIFRAAPIHHHFEALEWGESKVTMRFWIVGAFVAAVGVIVGIYGG